MRYKFVLVLCLLAFPFVLMAFIPFTERELEIIHNGVETTPFRILQVTDPVDSIVLRMQSEDVDVDSIENDVNLQLLIRRLALTMKESGGVGIAAPQVGVLKNVFVFMRLDLPDEPVQVVINPKIIDFPTDTVCFERDGCLSIPNMRANSLRFPWVEVSYLDEKGKTCHEHLYGHSRNDHFTAVIFQHEYDHLRGILFTDKICPEIGDGLNPLVE